MYFGIVKNINDPEKLGRVKVKVFDIHDNIETYELGWSQVMMGGNTPAINGQGHSVNLTAEVLWKYGELLPVDNAAKNIHVDSLTVDTDTFPALGDIKIIGSLVCGIFLDPLQQEFMVMGSLPTKSNNIEDNNIRVRGEADPNADDLVGIYQPPSPYAPQYPYNHVYETESGHVKEYDDTPGHERIMERHKSGTKYEIDANGSKVERIIRDNYQLVMGHDTLEVKGNVRIVVSGNCDLAVAKDLNAQVGGNMSSIVTGNSTSTIGGNLTADITGATNITSAGDMTLKVPTQVEAVSLSGVWGPSGKKIILNGDVDVTHTLRTNTDSAVTIQSDAINVNTHVHQHDVQIVPSTSYSEVPEPEE